MHKYPKDKPHLLKFLHLKTKEIMDQGVQCKVEELAPLEWCETYINWTYS